MIQTIDAAGIAFIGDPHISALPPGRRLEGFKEQILGKILFALDAAAKENLLPVFLGDFFHRPRDNPNNLLVRLMGLPGKWRPFILVGNHDKHLARYTEDVSLAVLEASGTVQVISEAGPACILKVGNREVLLGASPDGTSLPEEFQDPEGRYVIWITHHNIAFPEYSPEGQRLYKPRPLPGISLVVNGHIHRRLPTKKTGSTLWANPGNIARLTFSQNTLERRPAFGVWRPEPDSWPEDLEWMEIPHKPFFEVFPDIPFPEQIEGSASGEMFESNFLSGLERLALRRTREGVGLKEFLQENLDPQAPESEIIWELYKEAINFTSK